MYDIFMNLKQMLYQMFIVGIDPKNTANAIKNGVSGLIFFTKDIPSKDVLIKQIKDFKDLAEIPLFFSIDQEGGRVERTENIHNGKKYLSAKFAYEKGLDFLKTQTDEISEELKTYGINLNFAPCTDVNTNPNNPIIGERAFSDKVEEVIEGAKVVIESYKTNGIIPCIKHFPGHGDTSVDSHKELPFYDMTLEEMEQTHIKPFKALKDSVDLVMVAHLNAKCFEKTEDIPTSLSKNAIGYLRNVVKFDGVAISDDMFMKAVLNIGLEKACEMGIRAGINLFIYRDCSDEVVEMIENIYTKAQTDKDLQEKIESSYNKVMDLKKKYLFD